MPYKPYLRPVYPNELFHSSSELYHHGIKGQKWGVRRYQNPDGSLTEAGKKRYAKSSEADSMTKEAKKRNTVAKQFENEGFTPSKRNPNIFYEKVSKDYKPDKYHSTLEIDASYLKEDHVSAKELADAAKSVRGKTESMVNDAVDKIVKEKYEGFSDLAFAVVPEEQSPRKLSPKEFKENLTSQSNFTVTTGNGKVVVLLDLNCPVGIGNGEIASGGQFTCLFEPDGKLRYVKYYGDEG